MSFSFLPLPTPNDWRSRRWFHRCDETQHVWADVSVACMALLGPQQSRQSENLPPQVRQTDQGNTGESTPPLPSASVSALRLLVRSQQNSVNRSHRPAGKRGPSGRLAWAKPPGERDHSAGQWPTVRSEKYLRCLPFRQIPSGKEGSDDRARNDAASLYLAPSRASRRASSSARRAISLPGSTASASSNAWIASS